MAIGVGPGLLALQQGGGIGQAFGGDQALQRRQPMLVVVCAVVGLAAIFRGFEFRGQRRRPFFPCEMALLRELDREGERLGLPGLGEYRAAFVAGKPRQIGKALRLRSGQACSR